MAEGNAAAEEIKPTRFLNLWEYLVDLLPSCLLCCRKTRRWRGIDKARKILDAELNIIDIVKSRRYFHLALTHLLPKNKRKELIARSAFTEVNPSDESDSSDHDGGEIDNLNNMEKRIKRDDQYKIVTDNQES